MNRFGLLIDLYCMKRNSETVLTEWLVINSQMGEAEALQQLLSIWYPKLLGYAVQLLKSQTAAHDVTQMTLLGISKDIKKIRDPAAFPKWAFQLLRYKCADHIKHKQRDKTFESELQHYMQTDLQETKPDCDATHFELTMLDPDSRQLVYLHYFEEFSLHDVAQILSVPIGTVKSRLYAIRQQLKAML